MGANQNYPRPGVNVSAVGGIAISNTVSWSNANGFNFGVDSLSTFTASVAAGLSVAIQSISAGTTQVTSGQAVLSNSNGINFGVSGQTVTAGLPKISYWNNSAGPQTTQSWTTDSGGSNLHLQRVTIGMPTDATRVDVLAFGGSSWSIGFYTMTGSTASLLKSASAAQVDGGSTANWKSIALGTLAITPGDYLVGMAVTGGNTVNVQGVNFGNFASSSFLGVPGGGPYTSYFAEGLYSIGVSALPASIHVSDIVNSAEIRSWYLQLAGTF